MAKPTYFFSTLTPRYDHDGCPHCKFVGTAKVHKKLFGNNVIDVWKCEKPEQPVEVIVRTGDDGPEYVCYCPDRLRLPTDEAIELTRILVWADSPKWNAHLIRERLERSDKWVAEAIVRIFEYQTDEEQADGVTVEDNGVGFNGVDAEILSSFAQFYQKNGYLSPKQTAIGRNKIKKYAGQLANIANMKRVLDENTPAETTGDLVKRALAREA